jgi:hypothetical protein
MVCFKDMFSVHNIYPEQDMNGIPLGETFVLWNLGGGQMGDFSLRVKREIGKIAAAAPVAQPAPPVPTKPMLESIPAASIPTAPKPTALSAAIVKPVSNFGLLEAAADAGLLFVTSPKVLPTPPQLF